MTYMLRLTHPENLELWQRVKTRAAVDGWPLRSLILALLRGYADGRLTIPNPTAEARGVTMDT